MPMPDKLTCGSTVKVTRAWTGKNTFDTTLTKEYDTDTYFTAVLLDHTLRYNLPEPCPFIRWTEPIAKYDGTYHCEGQLHVKKIQIGSHPKMPANTVRPATQ
jgi:hypothetical protein